MSRKLRENGRLGMADIWRTYGGYTADGRRTYGGHTENKRRSYGEHTANKRQKWWRTYGWHTPLWYFGFSTNIKRIRQTYANMIFRFHPSIPLIPTHFISLFHAFVVQQSHHSHTLDSTCFYFMSIHLLVVLYSMIYKFTIIWQTIFKLTHHWN